MSFINTLKRSVIDDVRRRRRDGDRQQPRRERDPAQRDRKKELAVLRLREPQHGVVGALQTNNSDKKSCFPANATPSGLEQLSGRKDSV